MGRACRTIGARTGAYRALVEKPAGKRPAPGTDGRIILRWIFKNWNGDIDWIHLAEDRDR